MSPVRISSVAIAIAISGLIGPHAAAQSVFSEGLDAVGASSAQGPTSLTSVGWQFGGSTSAGVTLFDWRQGPWHAGQPTPWEGAGFLTSGIDIPPFGPHSYARWIIFPEITGQAAGHVASAFVRGFTSSFPIAGSIQLRYSPTGGTAIGSTPAETGDFTEILDANSNGSSSAWDQLQASIPGSGRLAIRWVGTINAGIFGTVLDLEVDDFTLTPNGVSPLLPQPGETVHWTLAMSPIHLVNQQVVPAGATLIVDAGVQIFFDFNTPTFTGAEMTALGGHIRFDGTSTAPVVLRRGVNTTQVPSISVGSGLLATVGTAGTLEVVHVDSDVSIVAAQSAMLAISESSFARSNPIDWSSATDALYQVPRVAAKQCTIVVENCNFYNAIAQFDDSAFEVKGCTFDNSALKVVRFPIAHAVTIDDNVFVNSNIVAPIEIDGYDACIGSGNTIAGNIAPLSLRGAGLTPDSAVPAAGNVDNRIQLTGSANGEIVGPMTLPPMAAPYHLWAGITTGQQFDARLRFLPGTTVEMAPGAYFSCRGVARNEILGTPEAPVRFVRAVPSQPWLTFQVNSAPPLIIRNAIFDGGEWAVGGVDTSFTVHDSTVMNSSEGVRAGDYCAVYLSKMRFSNNGTGARAIWGGGQGMSAQGVFVEFGASNASSFEGNGQGAVVDFPQANPSSVIGAWWDSPLGPVAPTNPNGNGQSASVGVDVVPFRTTPVDFDNHPPVVRALPVARHRRLRVGQKIIFHWEGRDDGAIVSQRLEFRPANGFGSGNVVVPAIPPDARSVELTIPDNGGGGVVYRILAVDDAGQEGFDDFHYLQGEDHAFGYQFFTDLSGGYRVGENFEVDVTGDSTTEYELHIDDLPRDIQLLGYDGGVLSAGRNVMPAVSTDLARYAAIFLGEPHYSPYFTIRPQAGLGDAPPVVAVTSPGPGETYSGGAVIPVEWTASDDRGLRSFDLQASYDGGESWHPFAEELAGARREYDWILPASTGISDLRIRVIARDTRFQVTSSTVTGLGVLPGDWHVPTPEIVASTTLGVESTCVDFTITAGGAGSYSWDLDGDAIEDSTVANPHFEYAAGLYDVSVSITSGTGNVLTISVPGMIRSVRAGDVTGDGAVNLADPVGLAAWLFAGGNALPCAAAGDANGDGGLNLADVVSLLQFLFAGGLPPFLPPPCTPCD
ncbi:MAG: hypothetical protein AB7O52_16740 [Planctomycetota bacterium]